MKQVYLRRIIVAASFAAISLVCWLVAEILADRAAKHELQGALNSQQLFAQAVVDNMAQTIASDLTMARAIPETLAETDAIRRVLVESRDYAANGANGKPVARDILLQVRGSPAANRLLRETRGYAGLDNIWLVNLNGIVVATSNAFEPTSFLGLDLHTRRYVKEALLGATGLMYGVGRQTHEAGVYISLPVYDNGLLIGVAVAKVGLGRLRHWVAAPGSFVTDENGVVVMANDSTLEGSTMPGARAPGLPPERQRDDYGRTSFTQLEIMPLVDRLQRKTPWLPNNLSQQVLGLPGNPVPSLYATHGGMNSGFASHLLDPVTLWPHVMRGHLHTRMLWLVVLEGTTVLAYVLALGYGRLKRQHRKMQRLTAQLQASNERLAAEAREDALTGALTRRYFLALLKSEIESARANDTPLCLAIADLDFFKQINDQFGHAGGDYALQHFVACCKLELRATDAVGRVGGEEFAILLTGTSLADGLRVTNRLRETFFTARCEQLPAEARLAASIGITELVEADTVERLIMRADRALYAGKSAGRNCTVALQPDIAESKLVHGAEASASAGRRTSDSSHAKEDN